ncbi:MAG: hemerythrin domain-containing protein [Chitinophagaceae bacterium]
MRRNEHIVKLSREHHFTLLFCWKIRRGLQFNVASDRMIKYVHYFWQHHMQPHFAEEETILFSPLKDAEVQKALDEHEQIANQIRQMNTGEEDCLNQLSILADTVDSHVRYEERELFPHLEKVLTDEQLDDIGKKIAANHDPVSEVDFADEFWLKNEDGL